MNVSTGKNRDRIVIYMDFTEFDSTVTDNFILEARIPKQVPLNQGTEALQTASSAAESVTTAATVGSGIA